MESIENNNNENLRHDFFLTIGIDNGFKEDKIKDFMKALEKTNAVDCMTDEEIVDFWNAMASDKNKAKKVWKSDERLNYALNIISQNPEDDDKIIISINPNDSENHKRNQLDTLYDKIKLQNLTKKKASLDDSYDTYPNILQKEKFEDFATEPITTSVRFCVEFDSKDLNSATKKFYLYHWFHELSCFRIKGNFEVGIIRIIIGLWMKEIPVLQGLWINFAEMDLPCFEKIYPVIIQFRNFTFDVIHIYGVKHCDSMLNVKKMMVDRGEYCPKKFGFRYGLHFFD